MALTFTRRQGPAVSVTGGGTDTNTPNISAYGTTAEWTASGHVLGVGELGLDTTTGNLRAGDGASLFSALTASDSGTYVPVLTPVTTVTYNGDGTVATQTINGVVSSYTYNGDGTVATETRAGVVRTFTYNGDGTLASVA